MPESTATATWTGTLTEGGGEAELDSGAWAGDYGTAGAADVTDPEELLAAAHASCFAMTIAYVLADRGYSPESVRAESVVTIEFREDEMVIPTVDVTVSGTVPDAVEEEFAAVVEYAEAACPVSKALADPDIEVTVAPLEGPSST